MTEQDLARAIESGMPVYLGLLFLRLLYELLRWQGFRRRRL